MGSKNEMVPLLIDTMATGSAVNYKYRRSTTAETITNDKTVSNTQEKIEFKGKQIEDRLCVYDYYNLKDADKIK